MHYYNPVTISFGPYHHGKPELQAAEKLKNCGMRTYISEAGKSIEDFSVRYLKRMPTLEAVMLLVQRTNMMMRNLQMMMLQDSCFCLYD